MIIVLGGIKGGAGKSLIAANLAGLRSTQGNDVLLIDGDQQGTSYLWSQTRSDVVEDDSLTCIRLTGKSARTEVLKLAPKYDDVIIDVGGRDTTTQRAALTVADLVLIPFPPRGPDIWTLDIVVELLEEIRTVNPELDAQAFVNRADPRGTETQDAIDFIQEAEGIKYLDAPIGDRKAFPSAHTDGLCVFEFKRKDRKAITELKRLYQYCFST